MNRTTILIVEDEAIVAADLAGKLGRLGYEVAKIAASGEEAVAAAVRLRPDLVLMDVWLEGPVDGIAAAEAIRREHDVPVIYLTAHSDAKTLARAKLTGPSGYILKPFEERDLATQIELALHKHEADQRLRRSRDELETKVKQRTAELASTVEALQEEVRERRAAQEMIQAERQRFHDVLDTLPVYVALLAPDYHVPFANRFFENRFGKSEGRRCYEYLFCRDEPCEDCETYKVLKTGAPHRWEWTGPDGRTYDIYDFPFTDTDGDPRIMEVGLDITEIKRAQAALEKLNENLERSVAERTAALEKSRERLAWVLDTTGVGLWLSELPLERLNWDARARELFFIPPDVEPTIDLFWQRLHPDDREPTRRAVEAALGDHTLYAIDHRVVHPETGEVRWIRSAGQASCAADGTPIHFDGVSYDISERKRAEERSRLLSEVTSELLASNEPQRVVETLCRRVMDHLGCQAFFNYLVDEQAGRLYLNACAGLPEEVVRRIESLDFGVAVCGCVARDGCPIVAEHIQTTPDPRTDLVRSFGIQAYACHPLMNQGRVIGTLSFGSRIKPAFAEDELALMKAVTDHVAIAMQRMRLVESLERHARAAEAANEAKGRFLANMSHELRTPMNAILGLIDVALPKAVDPTVKDCLQTAKESADLLLTLLNDLLDSAKIESGKLELESAPFSLRRMLDQITRVLAVRASEKGLAFYCRVPEKTPDVVVGDRMRLQQVLLNLASNAIKFTERGEVEISLRSMSQDAEACLEFAVRDTGIGIPPSSLDHLFEPFAQADATTARRFGGTGLGLAISRNLVEMMGGRIWAESRVGTGSTFYVSVRLPLSDEVPSDAQAPLAIPKAAHAPLRVLVVEDNPANQKLTRYILEDRGHLVDVACDGHEALRLTEKNCYDVILMDVQLPGMDGLEAAAAIRKRQRGGGRVPIIAMTAHAMKDDRDRCLSAGMDGYLSKPINALEMVGLVESFAAETAGRRPAAEPERAPSTAPKAAAVFDPQQALARCFNNQEIVRGMIRHFLGEADDLLAQMRAALEQGDLTTVGQLGHRIKGTVIYLGAESASRAALSVERFCTSSGGTPSEAEEAINALESECIVLKSALAEHPLGAGIIQGS